MFAVAASPSPSPAVRTRGDANAKKDCLPWVEKYRPTELSQIVHHESILQILRAFLRNKAMPHLFFYGPPGVGKTSTILSCAREIYGRYMNLMVLHLNASDERGVNVVRKQVIQFASTANMFCLDTYKLIILDEADSMTVEAQIALRDILMTYSTNARFCLIGNYQYSLIPSLQSRMIKLLFTPVPIVHALRVVQHILTSEQVPYDHDAIEYIYRVIGGDLRKYINVLQSLCLRTDDGARLTRSRVEKQLCRATTEEITAVVQFFRGHTMRESHAHMHALLQHHTQDFMTWVREMFDVYVRHLRDDAALQCFCEDMSLIEYNACTVVYYDVQLFAFVCCCHRYATQLVEFPAVASDAGHKTD